MDEEEIYNYKIQAETQGQLENNLSGAIANQYSLAEREVGLADAQLEVDSIKEEVYHLIRQDIRKMEKGKFKWVSLPDQSQRTLSDWGVDRIMQIIHFYVNKNTLLSNFNEEQINRLMLRFIKELNDLILLKYQVLFREPTFEECKNIILKKLDDRKKMRMFALEILGKEVNEEKIKKELLEEMEQTLEKEMEKTRSENRKQKIRDYGLIIAQLEIIVFSTLNRAYRGEERGSLRRHMNVSELINPTQKPQAVNRGFFSWGRK